MSQLIARLEGVYSSSEDIVAREIEGELIIVPLASGIGDLEDELYTMNETGRVIWEQLNGKQSLNEIIHRLSLSYEISESEMEKDVLGIVSELLKRKLIIEIAS